MVGEHMPGECSWGSCEVLDQEFLLAFEVDVVGHAILGSPQPLVGHHIPKAGPSDRCDVVGHGVDRLVEAVYQRLQSRRVRGRPRGHVVDRVHSPSPPNRRRYVGECITYQPNVIAVVISAMTCTWHYWRLAGVIGFISALCK